ncbi:MAG: YpdA family putative bacillithiol disulfide reductase [Acidobacteriota bacterium]|nr:YpdA family putative bacillithiol disulfide reductase [Blastocatellia bacterium]MDW8238701.1 YpdA family putative bacillithiol disulfide reductase [Acidobacteriota bacterium]
MYDVIVVGAGPTGLACAIELQRAQWDYLVIEKGCLVNSLAHFPKDMVYFTTPELLEIGDLPMVCLSQKPTRLEALKYYRRVAQAYRLNIHQYERVIDINGEDGSWQVLTETSVGQRHSYAARKVILATGYYDHPNRLGIPGEDSPKCSHYYTEAHPYFQRDVAVIGAGNSAAEAALDLFRGGARVTLIHRGEDLSPHLKYWIAPDLRNRISSGDITALFNTLVVQIKPQTIVTESLKTGERNELANDFVFALTGYHADVDFLRRVGIHVDGDTLIPAHDPQTLESNVKGIYLAGPIIAGRETNKIFIENGRFHGRQIMQALRSALNRESLNIS